MRMLLTTPALGLALCLAQPSLAQPAANAQLVASVEGRLVHYGFEVDASGYSTATLAALHLTMAQRGPYWEKRRMLQTILRKAGEDE